MKVSLNWLQNYVDISGISVEDIAQQLTLAGVETENIHKTVPIEGICLAYIKETKKHPDADKLTICQVFDGEKDLQIVCGAPNAAQGQTVVLAKVGTTFPNGLVIKESEIRGVLSCGMLCSESELGISDSSDGIMVLPAGNYTVGADANRLLGLGDTILELAVTPNRGDCLSMYGVAREIAAIFERPLAFVVFAVDESGVNAENLASVEIKNEKTCPYYSARIIQGVTITPSPLWIQTRLKNAGMRPVNNVVDVTNYIMLEYGQPLHAFDLDAVDKGIIVRDAEDGETITTLDGKERKLDNSMMVIADHSKLLAVAGVMGSIHSGVTGKTTDLLLECAYFEPSAVGMTAKKLGINSDSSYRYARGVDHGQTRTILDYAADLINDVCGGITLAGALSCGNRPPAVRTIITTAKQISDIVGMEFTDEQIDELLGRLGIMCIVADEKLYVSVPSYRPDIVHAAGVAEEVARIYGLHKIPVTLPKIDSDGEPLDYPSALRKEKRRHLASLGFNEVVNYSFMANSYLTMFTEPKNLVSLINPISKDMETLRSTVFPGVLKTLETNWNQGYKSVRVFEFATVFTAGDKKPNETPHLCIGIMGDYVPMSWAAAKNNTDTFYYLKGVCDSVLSLAGITAKYRQANDLEYMHPGKTAYVCVGDDVLGFVGALHPETEEKLDLKAPVYIAELNYEMIIKHAQKTKSYKRFGRFPHVYKDISVVTPSSARVSDMIDDIYGGSDLVREVILYDKYNDSLTFRILFSDDEATLTDEAVNPLLMDIAKSLDEKFGAKLR